MSRLYFGYGSNLNSQDWNKWCAAHNHRADCIRPLCPALLPDYEPAFTRYSEKRKGGVLDIRRKIGSAVSGIVFEVDSDGWQALDLKEGHPNTYRRVPVTVICGGLGDFVCGAELQVDSFRVKEPEQYVRPSDEYLDICRVGRANFHLPTEDLDAAANNLAIPCVTDAFFFYGTLMRGESRFEVVKKCGLQCTLIAKTPGRLLDLGDFPGMVDVESATTHVRGDFIRVRQPTKLIQQLDLIEGFRGFGSTGSVYRRTLITVDIGKYRTAWAYVFDGGANQANEISSGCWRTHCGKREDFIRQIVAKHCQGRSQLEIAERLAARLTFSNGPDDSNAPSLLPLEDSLLRGELSERLLAQVSKHWSTIP